MAALRGSGVPVPRWAYCEDTAVVGTPFYLMEYLEGRVLVDQSLPGMAPAERGAIYLEMNRVLAALHAVDPAAVGLADYEADYVAMYAQATGRDVRAHWDFCLAYNLFRMAAILHDIAQRAADGNATADDAVETGRKAGPLAELGWQCAQRHDRIGA